MKNKYFKHYKGNWYYVVDIGTHTETNEKYVCYINLYKNENVEFGKMWIRPYSMWNEQVNGKLRFEELVPTDEIRFAYENFINKN
jgi:hypothetical protein